jgi:hypothetical protein
MKKINVFLKKKLTINTVKAVGFAFVISAILMCVLLITTSFLENPRKFDLVIGWFVGVTYGFVYFGYLITHDEYHDK